MAKIIFDESILAKVPESRRPAILEQMNDFLTKFATTAAFDDWTIKFSDTPGGLPGARGFTDSRTKLIELNSNLRLSDEISSASISAKSFADVAVHELLHVALPQLTDPLPYPGGNAETLHNFDIPSGRNIDSTDVANAYNERIAELLDRGQITDADVLSEYVYRKIAVDTIRSVNGGRVSRALTGTVTDFDYRIGFASCSPKR